MKQSKKDILKQFIDDTLENKKEFRVKKRYVISIVLLFHLIEFSTVFVFLDTPNRSYSSWGEKSAKVKFERREQKTRPVQNTSELFTNKNEQSKINKTPEPLPKAQPKPEVQPKPQTPSNLPVYNGLNLPKSKDVERMLPNTGSEERFDEFKKETTKEKPDNKKATTKQAGENNLPEIKEQEKKVKTIDKKELENPREPYREGQFIKRWKELEHMLLTSTFDQEAKEAQEATTTEIKKIEPEKKIDPRDYVIKKAEKSEDKKKPELFKPLNPNEHASNKKNKSLTLAQMSKDFLGYAEQQGDNLVKYVNSVAGIPTDEQIKFERYGSKILSCIDTTLKIIPPPFTTKTNVSKIDIKPPIVGLTINNTVGLEQVVILQSTGSIELDKHLLMAINRSSKGFPPLPKNLNKDKISFSIHYS